MVCDVLVVDDEPAVRDLLRMNLEMDGHRVVAEASDGEQALEALQAADPDVVVLDMMMPGTAGDDVLRRMPARDRERRPWVVAYSASPSHLQVADELGADVVVLKSGDMEPLLAAVNAA